MQIRPLVFSDAAAVTALANQVYPDSFHLSEQDIIHNLELEHLCLGLFEHEQLKAYLMCWQDTTQVEDWGDELVLLLDDIVVLEGRHLFLLLRALRQAIVVAGLQYLPMEGTHRPRARDLFSKHPRVVAALGYRQQATHHYLAQPEGEIMCWARYQPIDPQEATTSTRGA